MKTILRLVWAGLLALVLVALAGPQPLQAGSATAQSGPSSTQAALGKQQGKQMVTGGEKYHFPDWFKVSFLDLTEDLKEAADSGKHLAVFFHLDECPYCAKMLRDSLTNGPVQQFAEQHFDFVALNIKGNVEVTWVDGKQSTLTELAKRLNVFATPTIQVFDPEGKVILNLQGYREAQAFRSALTYVQSGGWKTMSLKAWQDSSVDRSGAPYKPAPHPSFTSDLNLAMAEGPLLVLFESSNCQTCGRFAEKTLMHPKVLQELLPFKAVRLMTDGSRPVITPDGRRLTEKAWADELLISYTPSVLLFDQKKLLKRIETGLYHQHMREALAWISSRGYQSHPSISAFKAEYRQMQMDRGEPVDYSE